MFIINFTRTSLFFSLLLVVCLTLDWLIGLSNWVYFGLYVAYSYFYFRGAFQIDSNFFMPVLCSEQTTDLEIAVSFDDGPSSTTLTILQTLAEHDVPAAFFCVGKQIEMYPEILQKIHHQGHLIGNHSYSHHFWFDCFTTGKMLDDMQRMDTLVEKSLGLRLKLFRPPYGVTLPWLRRAVERGEYTPIGWSVRSLDTLTHDKQKLLNKVNSAIEPGAVFLFHDTNATTAAILSDFLTEVRTKGYRVVPLDSLLGITAYK